MRTSILALAAVFALTAMSFVPVAVPPSTAAAAGAAVSGVVLHAQEAPAPPARVDVQINHDRGWRVSPVWVAIGAIALVLLIVLIIMAARGSGGGTTFVR